MKDFYKILSIVAVLGSGFAALVERDADPTRVTNVRGAMVKSFANSRGVWANVAAFAGIRDTVVLSGCSRSLRSVRDTALPLMGLSKGFLTDEGKITLPGFSELAVTPAPKSVRVTRAFRSAGEIEIRFKDAEHLMDMAERLPYIASERVRFVLDPHAELFDEIHADKGLSPFLAVRLTSDIPLKISGKSRVGLPLIVPHGTRVSAVDFAYEGGGSIFFEDDLAFDTRRIAKEIAAVLPDLTPASIAAKTALAERALQERVAESEGCREDCPGLGELRRSRGFSSFPDGEVVVRPIHDFEATRFFHIGGNRAEVNEVFERFPARFSASIFLTLPGVRGVYFSNDVYLRRGFEISAAKSLVVCGSIELPHHNLLFVSGESDCFVFANVKARKALYVSERVIP